jgi:predicted enzyme related to lactoylglutathione lyase
MAGEVCWVEVNTPDAAGTTAFYSRLFGWQTGDGDVGFPYQFLKRPGEAANFGGVMPQKAPGGPPHWMVYFAVADLDAALKQVAKLGGKQLSPVVTMPQGRFAAVADPHGAAFAVYQAKA